jgi:hypothetical protein
MTGGGWIMKLENLVSGKNEQDSVSIDGTSVPVKSLKRLIDEGYVHVRVYQENRTFSLWGESCTSCFTEGQLLEKSR